MNKAQVLKAIRENDTYRRPVIQMTMDFSLGTMEVRTQYHNIFKELKEKKLSTLNFISSKNILQKLR